MSVRCQLSQNSTTRPMHGGDEPAHQLHQAGADEIADALGVAHDARHQHAGLGGVEVAHRQAHDVRLHALAHVGDGALRRDAEDLRQRERGDRLDQRWPPAAASAIGTSRSVRPLPSTSSMIHLEASGSTSCDTRLTSIRTRPMVSRRRWAQTSWRASRQAAEADTFFFF